MKQEMKKFIGYKILKNLYIGSIDSIELDKVVLGDKTNTHFYYFYNRDSKKWAIPQGCKTQNPFIKQQIRKGLEIVKEHFLKQEVLEIEKDIFEFKKDLVFCMNYLKLQSLQLDFKNQKYHENQKKIQKETEIDEIRKLSNKFIIKQRKGLSISLDS